jgi:hypothetical protein
MSFGIGLMFLAGKVLPAPVPAAIAGGITLAIVGFVVVVIEALRDPPAPDMAGAPAEERSSSTSTTK